MLVFAGFSGTLYQVNTTRIGLHFFRNLAHFSFQNLWFLAVAYIPLSQLFALESSTPIWVALLAPFFLQEALKTRQIISVVFGFVGVLIIVRPDVSHFNPAVLAAMTCALCFAGSMMANKKLTQDQLITCILFWLTLMQFGMGLVTSAYNGELVILSGINNLWVLTVGLGGLMAHFCITKALALAPAVVVVPLDFMRLPLISVVGFLVYDEMFEWDVIIGALFIFFATLINLKAEQKQSQLKS
ncbi:DMT family transporter [Candidatus Puniceispirillum sp.]|nr:DMT family transporter [Candidatus Puniceispirillum sp.]